MNIILAAAAFALCTAGGLYKSALLKKRAALLCELKQLVDSFAISIRYTAPTLDELADGCGGVFGELLRQARQNSPNIKSAWQEAAAQLAALPFSGEEEARLMAQLGRELGTCDAAGQLSMLEMYAERLKKLSDEAEENAAAKGKLLRSAGTLLGIGAAILII